MGDEQRGRSHESAEMIQAKAARSSNLIALLGVIVTAVGTVGGLIVTVVVMKSGKEEPAAVHARPPTDIAADTPDTPTTRVEPVKAAHTPPSTRPSTTKTASPAPVRPGARAVSYPLGEGVKLECVLISPGEFKMGSPDSEKQRGYDEGPQLAVKLTKPFYLGKYEVTQAQYERVMGTNPSHFEGADLPVENVSWEEAAEFCRRLSKRIGRTARLPTEAEWEYACRAGTTTPFHFGPTLSSDRANLDGTRPYGAAPQGEYRKKTLPVGSFPANAWGLHDMHGNVQEWCNDWYNAGYPRSARPVKDPTGPETGSARVLRGGSWPDKALSCRSAERALRTPAGRSNDVGFRVAVSAEGN